MNIAIFTPNQNPYSETFIQAHKNYLEGNIFYYYGRSHIQLENHPYLVSKCKLKYYKIKKLLLRKPFSYVQENLVTQSLIKHNINVVLIEYGTHAHRVLSIIKKAKLPLIVHFHGYDASITEVIKKHNNYKDVFHYASKVIVVSKKMETMLIAMGCPKNKIVWNVTGPQPEFLSVIPTFSKKQFIAIGRFVDKKAPYYTILAFKKVLEKHEDAKLIMAGSGSLENTCKNLAKYLNIQNQVNFVGVITPEKYREFLTESLAFVQHSITADSGDMEGTPVSMLEASAAGVPVISTIHAGIPDIVIHQQTGLLCEEHDIDTMANNMLSLLDSITLAKKYGANAKKRIVDNFTLDRHIKQLQELLETVIP